MSGPIAVWDFRSNGDHFEDEFQLMGFLHKLGKKFHFQLEKTDEGYVHWQGRISLWKKKRKCELIKLMEGMDMRVPNYLCPTTAGESGRAQPFYYSKEDTRIRGPWNDRDIPAYIPRQYRGLMDHLYPFQRQIMESRDIFEKRIVDCVVAPEGGEGKSTIAALMELHGKGIDMPTVNDGQALINMTCDILISRDCREPGLMFFDMPRSQSKEKLHGLFTAIEQIKKGKVYDPRYSYKDWWFDSPRVWIFMNEDPDVRALTSNRWRFWTISAHKRLVKYVPPVIPAYSENFKRPGDF